MDEKYSKNQDFPQKTSEDNCNDRTSSSNGFGAYRANSLRFTESSGALWPKREDLASERDQNGDSSSRYDWETLKTYDYTPIDWQAIGIPNPSWMTGQSTPFSSQIEESPNDPEPIKAREASLGIESKLKGLPSFQYDFQNHKSPFDLQGDQKREQWSHIKSSSGTGFSNNLKRLELRDESISTEAPSVCSVGTQVKHEKGSSSVSCQTKHSRTYSIGCQTDEVDGIQFSSPRAVVYLKPLASYPDELFFNHLVQGRKWMMKNNHENFFQDPFAEILKPTAPQWIREPIPLQQPSYAGFCGVYPESTGRLDPRPKSPFEMGTHRVEQTKRERLPNFIKGHEDYIRELESNTRQLRMEETSGSVQIPKGENKWEIKKKSAILASHPKLLNRSWSISGGDIHPASSKKDKEISVNEGEDSDKTNVIRDSLRRRSFEETPKKTERENENPNEFSYQNNQSQNSSRILKGPWKNSEKMKAAEEALKENALKREPTAPERLVSEPETPEILRTKAKGEDGIEKRPVSFKTPAKTDSFSENAHPKDDYFLLDLTNQGPEEIIEEQGVVILPGSFRRKTDTNKTSLADAFARKKQAATAKKPPRPEVPMPSTAAKSQERNQKTKEELHQIRKEMMRNRSKSSQKGQHSVSFSQSEEKLNALVAEKQIKNSSPRLPSNRSERKFKVPVPKGKGVPGVGSSTPKINLDLFSGASPDKKCKTPKEPPLELLERLAKGEKPSISRKEMFELTRKNYAKLPEVREKQRRSSESSKTDFIERMDKRKALDQRVRDGILKKKS